jgi:hypothetical protein
MTDKYLMVAYFVIISFFMGAYMGSEIRVMQHDEIEMSFAKRLMSCNNTIMGVK